MDQIRSCSTGIAGARHRAAGAARSWPASCRGSTRRCSTRSTRTRTRAGRPSSSAPPATTWSRCSPGCSAWTAASARATRSTRDGPLHGRARRPVHVRRGQGRGRCAASPTRTTSTSPSRGPTRTRPRTCRCCARSATPVAVNPDARAGRGRPRAEGWRVMRFEKLGRRLAIARGDADRQPPSAAASARSLAPRQAPRRAPPELSATAEPCARARYPERQRRGADVNAAVDAAAGSRPRVCGA